MGPLCSVLANIKSAPPGKGFEAFEALSRRSFTVQRAFRILVHSDA
jgi:hypothetical protein